ncbi:hypothetical protein JQC91_09255 [Jannaschia sp. Os4]|uniref:hypothetical protein n=1 Tax=Jannaschia sp. Os4 TaxID=2807617 RepID=UPI001939B7CD|nr:hypothetical protein [Jannaschia sp. Os4]MBM2576494.1 hypothetical protein [Jannaschia sp. Os4]
MSVKARRSDAVADAPLVAPDPATDPRTGPWTTLHRLALVAAGLGLSGPMAAMMRHVLDVAGAWSDPAGHLALIMGFGLALLPGAILALPPLTPRFVARPRNALGWIAAMALVLVASMVPAAALGIGAASAGVADLSGTETFEAFRLAGTVALSATAILALAAIGEARVTPPAPRTLALRFHLVVLALVGAGQAIAIGALFLGPFAQEGSIGIALRVLAALSLTLLVGRTMPRFVSAPSRWYHWFGLQWWATFPATMAATFALAPVAEAVAAEIVAGGAPGAAIAGAMQALVSGPGLLLGLAVFGIGTVALMPSAAFVILEAPEVLRRKYDGPTGEEMVRAEAEAPRRVRKKAHARDLSIPAIGPMMGAYAAADWLVMRALGLAAFGAAYLQWQVLQSDAAVVDYLQIDLVAVEHQMWLYVAMGVALAVPFVLPRYISRPHRVLGGFLKAAVIVVAAYMLLPTATAVIEAYTPNAYHGVLLAAVPKVLKAVCGIAITAALLTSFFKQLGALPKEDGPDAKVKIAEDDLRALRHARLQMQGPGH